MMTNEDIIRAFQVPSAQRDVALQVLENGFFGACDNGHDMGLRDGQAVVYAVISITEGLCVGDEPYPDSPYLFPTFDEDGDPLPELSKAILLPHLPEALENFYRSLEVLSPLKSAQLRDGVCSVHGTRGFATCPECVTREAGRREE